MISDVTYLPAACGKRPDIADEGEANNSSTVPTVIPQHLKYI